MINHFVFQINGSNDAKLETVVNYKRKTQCERHISTADIHERRERKKFSQFYLHN